MFIGNITFDEVVVWIILDLFQIFKITGIGKTINVDEIIIRINISHIVDEIRTDEPTTTGYQDSFFHRLLPPF